MCLRVGSESFATIGTVEEGSALALIASVEKVVVGTADDSIFGSSSPYTIKLQNRMH